ncbi:MAG: EVE domain-containing protein [Fimbriimonadaceae bacterium]|nr:EVE domain-containing protein [Fimbriimonadaceae bacterium]
MKAVAYWLMKSEPDVYSIHDLAKKKGPDLWEGCRNYTVRNFMRDKFQPGDFAFFYNSVTAPIGIAGTMKIVRGGYPDPTQFDPKHKYYDPKSPPENPRWMGVDVAEPVIWPRILTLDELRSHPRLSDMMVLQRGQRLSVMPVTEEEWQVVHELIGLAPPKV